MVFTSYRIASLRKAEESLFASGLAWWQEWQEWHGLSTPGRPTTFEPQDVSTGPKTHVHMVRATAESADPNGMPLVCLHGFAHGTSCFYTAAAPLAEAYTAGPVFILDMPGCGLSSRPAYAIAADPEQRRLEAENFFCDELEAWRKAMGIERMVLAGHSVGGHSAFAYAERHPERVERLVLISPAGVPRPPKDFDPKGHRDKPLLFQLAFSLWERGYSPLSMVRSGAGWGPGRWLVNSYVRRRLGTGATWDHPELYAEYMYCNHVAGEGSWGAAVHTTLLMPGAYARNPLCDRFATMDWARGPSGVAFIYGDAHDWMERGAAEAVRDGVRGMGARVAVCSVAGARPNLTHIPPPNRNPTSQA